MNKTQLLKRIIYRLNRDYPAVVVRYQGDHQLHISKGAEDGFDVVVDIGANENTLVFGEWHNHFEQSEEGESELLWVMSLGLSRLGRLSVTYRGTEAVRSAFETQQENGSWEWYAEMGTVTFNPFVKKTTRYFQNDLIPAKDIRPDPSTKDQ